MIEKNDKTYTGIEMIYHIVSSEKNNSNVNIPTHINSYKNRTVSTNRKDVIVKLRMSIREIPETLVTTSTVY